MTPQELKNSVLQRAFQGKLVEQRPEEGTGKELFQQIQVAKATLITKKEKALPLITEDDWRFDIPDTWYWCYIGDLFQHNTGKALNSTNRDGTILQYITTSNLYWNRFELDRLKEMPFTDAEIEKCTIQKGDLLVCEGGDCGRAAIWSYDMPMRIQNHIHRLRPYGNVSIEYFYYIFYLYKNAGWIAGKGIGIQGLSSNALHSIIIPLPPLAEQQRIVAKLEEVLPLIDCYEAAWNKLEEFNKRFPGDMQKSILQLAIQGKLVEQRPEEGTSEELFQQIQTEKQALIKAGKIKKEKPLPEIADDEIPFDIPDAWKWVRLRDLCQTDISYGIIKLGAEDPKGVRVLRCSDVKENHIIPDFVRTVEETLSQQFNRTILQGGEIVINVRGTLGGCAVVPVEMRGYNVAREVAVIRQCEPVVAQYLVFLLMSGYFQQFMFHGLRGIAYKGLNMGTLALLPVPLPPLAEQKRIVAKLDEILPLCDRLK